MYRAFPFDKGSLAFKAGTSFSKTYLPCQLACLISLSVSLVCLSCQPPYLVGLPVCIVDLSA
jgi:hypothetical protein